jgi:hypothetical protein
MKILRSAGALAGKTVSIELHAQRSERRKNAGEGAGAAEVAQ